MARMIDILLPTRISHLLEFKKTETGTNSKIRDILNF